MGSHKGREGQGARTAFPMAPQASPLQTRFTVEENGFLERFRVLKLVLPWRRGGNRKPTDSFCVFPPTPDGIKTPAGADRPSHARSASSPAPNHAPVARFELRGVLSPRARLCARCTSAGAVAAKTAERDPHRASRGVRSPRWTTHTIPMVRRDTWSSAHPSRSVADRWCRGRRREPLCGLVSQMARAATVSQRIGAR